VHHRRILQQFLDLEIFQQFPTNRYGRILKQVRHALSFAPATLVSEAKIETGARTLKLVRADALSFGPATLVSATRMCAPTVTTTGTT